jgi:hypothetical protein
LTAARAREFDDQLETLVRRYRVDDVVQLSVSARITWGRPGEVDGPVRRARYE